MTPITQDQRWLREKNRNPQGELVMKCDKCMSHNAISPIISHLLLSRYTSSSNSALPLTVKSARAPPKLAANPIKMKTNVLNKIVREASGVFNYTLVPPINAQRVKAKGAIDPDTWYLLIDTL